MINIYKKHISAAVLCCVFTVFMLSEEEYSLTYAQTPAPVYIDIDGRTAASGENKQWKGFCASLTGGTAQLLLDYKTDSPDSYEAILELLFGENGAGINSIKVEAGSDINSFSGTEPSVIRDEHSFPDVSSSPCWQVAADAKRINPSLSVEMIRTGEPKYVTDEFAKSEEAGMKARFEWYMACIDAVYEKFGIVPDIVCADSESNVRNDFDWIIYLSESLKSVQNREYSCSDIKISALRYDSGSDLTDEMNGDPRLMHAVNIIGCGDYSEYGKNEELLADNYSKDIRCTEGGVPAENTAYAEKAYSSDSGCSFSDTAENIISAFSSQMTCYEFKPAVSAYYSGMKYFPCGLLWANTPWSGDFSAEKGIYMAAHFTAFAESGWKYIENGCGDSYITLTDQQNTELTTVIVNNESTERTYTVRRAYTAAAEKPLNIWQTCTDCNMRYLGTAENLFSGGSYISELTVPAHSITTLTTTDNRPDIPEYQNSGSVLSLPYRDSFDYSEEYRSMHGTTAKYSCTEGGAFLSENGRLVQQLTTENKPAEPVGGTVCEPVLTLGDDRWHNYSASAAVSLDSEASDNYAGIGIRCNSSASYEGLKHSGYILRINGGGSWSVLDGDTELGGGTIENYSAGSEYSLKISAEESKISAYINGEKIFSAEDKNGFAASGRILLCSGFYRNTFDELCAEPYEVRPCSERIDALDDSILYGGNVIFESGASYTYYNRTYAFMKSGRKILDTAEICSGGSADLEAEGYDVLEITGSNLEKSSVFVDGSISPAEFSDGKLSVSLKNNGKTHSIHINIPGDGEIESIVLVNTHIPEMPYFEFDYSGGFSLIGENDGNGTVIGIERDGVSYDTRNVSPSGTREAFYTLTEEDGEVHHAKITVKSGSLLLDSAEAYPMEIKSISAEGDVSAESSEKYYSAENMHRNAIAETAVSAAEQPKGSIWGGIIAIILCALSAAALYLCETKLSDK